MKHQSRLGDGLMNSWLAFSLMLLLATVGLAAVLVLRSARSLIVFHATSESGERFRPS